MESGKSENQVAVNEFLKYAELALYRSVKRIDDPYVRALCARIAIATIRKQREGQA